MEGNQRKNPYSQRRDISPSTIFRLSDGWQVAAIPQAAPVDQSQGVAVTAWGSVHVIFYGGGIKAPALTVITVRPWRYFVDAPSVAGSGVREGHWIPGNDVVVAVDPNAVNQTRGSNPIFETHGAEKMFWQIVSVDEGNQPTWIKVVPYGYVRKDEQHVIAVASVAAGGSEGPDVNVIANPLMDLGECGYSNLKGDFDAIRVNASTVLIRGLTNFTPATENFYAIGRGATGGGVMHYHWRGIQLNCSYNPANGQLTVAAPFWPVATDQIEVVIEGPPRYWDEAEKAARSKVVNPSEHRNALDGTIAEETITGPQDVGLTQRYFPFNMAQDGYHQLTAQITIAEHGQGTTARLVAAILEGTDDIYPNDDDCQWTNIWGETFRIVGYPLAVSGPVVNLPLVPITGIHWRRCRWHVIAATVTEEKKTVIGEADLRIIQDRTAYDQSKSVDNTLDGFPLAFDADNIYSNIWGDFSVGLTNSYQIQVIGLTGWTPRAMNILGVGRINGALPWGPVEMRWRGVDLQVKWDEANYGIITPDVFFTAGSQFIVYLEGPPKSYDFAENARRVKVANDDPHRNALDGEMFNQLVAGPDEEVGQKDWYVPFNMAQDGYHQLTVQIYCADDPAPVNPTLVKVGLEATDDIYPNDDDCVWRPVFRQIFDPATGLDYIDANSLAPTGVTLVPVTGIHYRRLRWWIIAQTIEEEQELLQGKAQIRIVQSRSSYDESKAIGDYTRWQLGEIIDGIETIIAGGAATLGPLTVTADDEVAPGPAIAVSAPVATSNKKLKCITIKFTAAPTTPEDITITQNMVQGAVYDTVLYRIDPSVNADTDIAFIPSNPVPGIVGDSFDIAYPNTDTLGWAVRVILEE